MADGAIAVGVAARGPTGGFSWGAAADEGPEESKTSAVKICRGQDPNYRAPKGEITEAQSRCSVVGTFKDKCAAMAFNGSTTIPSTAYGWAIAANSEAAKNQALARCEAMRSGRGAACAVDAAICDGSAEAASNPVTEDSAQSQPGLAGDNLALIDFLGRWCPADNAFSYTFSHNQLHVQFRDGSTRDLTIRKTEYYASDNSLQIFWLPDRPGNSTSYTMSADKRMLIQLPQKEGDKGPRRELHRC